MGGFFFFKLYLVWREWTVQCPLGHLTFHASFIGGGGGEGGGFIFLSANRKG
jgi:hypothetical protein